MKPLKRPMEIWVTLYSHELLPEHRHYRGCDPPLANFIELKHGGGSESKP